MESVGELWTPLCVLVQKSNSFLQLPVQGGSQQLRADAHAQQSTTSAPSPPGRGSGGCWKGGDQPNGHLNRKERASTTGLQTRYQLPVWGWMKQIRNKNTRKKRGEGISLWKRDVWWSQGTAVGTGERKEGAESHSPFPKPTLFILLWKTAESSGAALLLALACWSPWGHFYSDV